MMAAAMLQSDRFGRGIACLGLLAEGIQMTYFVTLVLELPPAFLAIPPSTAAPFRLVWYLLIGRRLFRLARRAGG